KASAEEPWLEQKKCLSYDQSSAERAQRQRYRVYHRVAALVGSGFSLGQLQGTTPQVWQKLGGVRFLSIHGHARKLWRVQSERFSTRDALLPQERRSYSRATAHFYRRAK